VVGRDAAIPTQLVAFVVADLGRQTGAVMVQSMDLGHSCQSSVIDPSVQPFKTR